jgi:branched-chain amino acid transport system substrate-binding protein
LALVGLFTALALVAAACGGDNGGTTPAAKACDPTSLKVALGATSTRVGMAGEIRSIQAQAKPTISIGLIGDLTGSNASLVVPGRNAVALAVDQANAKGNLPVTLKFIPLDNKEANPTTAPPLAQRLVNDRTVVGVIGPAFSGETSAVQPIFKQAGLTHVTQSATRADLTTKGYNTFFRGVGGDTDQAAAAGKLIAALKCTKVAVIDDKSAYGQGLSEIVDKELKAAGIAVANRESIAKTQDYTSLVQTLIASKPDAVFYGGYQPEASKIVKQMREQGVTAAFISGDGSKSVKFAPDAGGANADNVLFTCPCLDANVSTSADAVKFVTDFKAKFSGTAPDIYAPEAYDVASIFIAAIEECGKAGASGVTRACVLKFVTDMKDFKGLTKTFNWTTDPKLLHEVTDKGVNIYAVKAGKIVLLGPIQKFAS